jgi:hypothetical protein
MTLEEFIDESINVAKSHRYVPSIFMAMWAQDRSIAPIVRLVESSEKKSGYVRMEKLGLKEWTLEAAVLKYPERFSRKTQEYARARLDGILDA